MSRLRVLVVDDSQFMRTVIADSLAADESIEVVAQAADGLEALDQVAKLQPDVVTLDIVMPKLSGFGTLERLMKFDHPPAVVMVSAYTQEDAEVTLDCLSMGAVDFVLKPAESAAQQLDKMATQLRAKVKVAAQASPQVSGNERATEQPARPQQPYAAAVIGSSTGGPVALGELLPALPGDLMYPVFVAQHLPAQFVESLTARLRNTCRLHIEVARDGATVHPGTIYFAPGGANTTVVQQPNGHIQLRVTASEEVLTPSVTTLMQSVAAVYKDATLGIILTGMGEDGLEGMRAIKRAGGTTVVQDEASSVVYGMARAVVQGELADDVVPLDELAKKIK